MRKDGLLYLLKYAFWCCKTRQPQLFSRYCRVQYGLYGWKFVFGIRIWKKAA